MLFIGEAPGASDDNIGQPFAGPAGHLLTDQIDVALAEAGICNSQQDENAPRIAFTNALCCIPKVNGVKVEEPPKECLEACQPRLLEFARLARARKIVCIGNIALKWAPAIEGTFSSITHPAAILRMEAVRKPLENKRVIATLRDVFMEL